MRAAFAIDSAYDQSVNSLSRYQHDETEDHVELRRINVLVIDDSDTDFRIVKKTLQLMDALRADVWHAHDLVSARAYTDCQTFDVALVDFCLGIDTGVRAIQELGGRLGSTALILLTGMPGQDIPQIALKAGAIQCLNKNQINPVLLETTIRSAIHTHQLELKLQEMIVDLEMANRAKTDFFARIGHDLKTPLNAILGYSEMISQQIFGPSSLTKYSECADNIRTGGMHLLEVLDNLIHHAASESSYSGGTFETVELNGLVQRAVAMADLLVRSRDHSLSVSVPDETIHVSCQPSVLTQAIVNVLSNAVKYTPHGGRISVSLRTGERHSEIAVVDNGIGMSNADIDVALLPFGRVELPSQFTQDGTGIGLPIVRDIMAAHTGQLEIDSVPGAGTTVVLRLPTVVSE